jgi:hypothetical protein
MRTIITPCLLWYRQHISRRIGFVRPVLGAEFGL